MDRNAVQQLFTLEQVLPVITKLTDRYTSKESSSVTYETANMLMEAVLYCIGECFQGNEGMTLHSEKDTDKKAEVFYKKGYELVVQKVSEANQFYEAVIDDFDDYGCENYRDTILKGMPAFFMKYDPVFNPQNHILTIDYPLLAGSPQSCGIDLIYEYLQNILWEKQLLSYFDREAVIYLLHEIMPDYRKNYYDNLCCPVLMRSVECMIADKPLKKLILEKRDEEKIEQHFMDKNVVEIEREISNYIRLITKQIPEAKDYFLKTARDYAVRRYNLAECHK